MAKAADQTPDAPVRHFVALAGGVGKYAKGDTFADYQLWDPKLDPEWDRQAQRLLDLGAIEEIVDAPEAEAPDAVRAPGSAVVGP